MSQNKDTGAQYSDRFTPDESDPEGLTPYHLSILRDARDSDYNRLGDSYYLAEVCNDERADIACLFERPTYRSEYAVPDPIVDEEGYTCKEVRYRAVWKGTNADLDALLEEADMHPENVDYWRRREHLGFSTTERMEVRHEYDVGDETVQITLERDDATLFIHRNDADNEEYPIGHREGGTIVHLNDSESLQWDELEDYVEKMALEHLTLRQAMEEDI